MDEKKSITLDQLISDLCLCRAKNPQIGTALIENIFLSKDQEAYCTVNVIMDHYRFELTMREDDPIASN